MAKISRESFNDTLRKRLGAILDSGLSYYTSAEKADRYAFGYGTELRQTTAVTTTTKVDDPEWDNIRLDIIKARTHQKGPTWVSNNLLLQNDTTTNNNIFDVNSIDDPRYAPDKIKETVFNYYNARITDLETDKFLADSSELEESAATDSEATNLTFATSARWEFTTTFSTAAQACQFFNSGGVIRLTFNASSRDVGGPAGKQSRDFVSMINSFGTRDFGATQFYANHRTAIGTATPAWASATSEDSAYSQNSIKLQARTNNNSQGSANVVVIRMVIESGYSGGQPIGNGDGFGDSVKIEVEPSVDIVRSNGVIVSPLPSNYSYGDWFFG